MTLEDILEEIVGEIDDEHDTALEGVRRQQDGSVYVDGHVTVRDLNRAMDWRLPEGDAVTIAGLVIHEAQMIPEPGQTFIFHHHRFQVFRRQRKPDHRPADQRAPGRRRRTLNLYSQGRPFL